MAGWPAGQRSSPCGIHSWICDRGYIRGRQLEELRGPAEGLSDGAARQLIVVGLIPCPFPCPAAWWKRSERRLWHRPPRPACDRPVAGGRAGRAGLDELGKIGFVADPVPDKAQPGQGFLDSPAWGGGLGCHHPVVGIGVMAPHRGVDDGHPPHRLTDHRERPRQIRCPYPGKPFCRGRHRGDRPLQRAGPGLQITRMLAVPFDPAAGRAEPGVLAARRERSAALLAVPYVCYHSCAPHWGLGGTAGQCRPAGAECCSPPYLGCVLPGAEQINCILTRPRPLALLPLRSVTLVITRSGDGWAIGHCPGYLLTVSGSDWCHALPMRGSSSWWPSMASSFAFH